MKGEGMQDGGMDEPDEANAPPDARDEKRGWVIRPA